MKKKTIRLLSATVVLTALTVFSFEPGEITMWRAPIPDPSRPDAGYSEIPGITHVLVFAGNAATGAYNHHANICAANGRLHLTWSNQRYAEDGPGQRVLYSSSANGVDWTPPREIVPALHPEAPWNHNGIHTGSGGFLIQNDRIFAKAWCGATVGWENGDKTRQSQQQSRECCFPVNRKYSDLYREIKSDGNFGPLMTEKPEDFPTDMMVYPVSFQEGAPGFAPPRPDYSWKNAFQQSNRRLCEPIMWRAKDGRYVLLLRDDSYSHRKFVSFSLDGNRWTPPAPTNISDAPSLSCVTTLEDGTVVLVGNHGIPHDAFDQSKPAHWPRQPLTLSLSRDGIHFTRTWNVRADEHRFTVPRQLVRGRGGSAQYPSIAIQNGICYVAYSMGKEDIAISFFPLSAITLSENK